MGGFGHPFPKIWHTYPTMMELGPVMPYVRKIKKHMNHIRYALTSADISIFQQIISKFYYVKKNRSKLDFDT